MVPHYYQGGITPLEYMCSTFTYEAYMGFLRGNILKYLARAGKKGDAVEDYKKAQVYMDELVRYAEFNVSPK